MKKILLSAVATTVIAGSAFANAPSPAFSGAYIGVGPTYSIGRVIIKDDDETTTHSSRGVGVNAFLGYGNVIQGGLYIGGEMSFGLDGSRFKKTVKDSDGDISGYIKSKSRFVYNIAARVGYAFSNFLPYIKFGYEGRSKITLQDDVGNNWGSLNRSGFLLGAGADYALTKNVFIRGEYHYNFGARKKFMTGGASFRTPTHAILIGAGYRF